MLHQVELCHRVKNLRQKETTKAQDIPQGAFETSGKEKKAMAMDALKSHGSMHMSRHTKATQEWMMMIGSF